MNILFLTLPILIAGQSGTTDTEQRFLGGDVTWQLSASDGNSGTLEFDGEDSVHGKAGCNTYTGPIDGTPETFVIGPLAVTRKACPDNDDGSGFAATLEMMVSGSATAQELILSDGEGTQMRFTPASD